MTQRVIEYPSEGFEGLIFDLDGTLIDSMEAHYEAMGQALEEEGGIGLFTKERYSELGGKPAADIVNLLNLENGLSMDAQKVCERQHEILEGKVKSFKAILRLQITRKDIVEESQWRWQVRGRVKW
jgi:beta-phosphoglucomutase-like phosphatase (HAD superfamily)